MLVKELMETNVFSVQSNKDFNHVEVVAELKNIRHVPVVDDNEHLIGILSIRDLLAHLSVAGASHFVPVKELMHKKVITISPEASVSEAAQLMVENRIGCLPVVQGQSLVGIITERDFLKLASELKS